MIAACDVGLIFLDYRFTIPNFPSRLLSYMQAKLPVLAATDSNSDIGKIIEDNGFGWWCISNDVEQFAEHVRKICISQTGEKGQTGWEYLNEKYTVNKCYTIIIS